MKNRANHNTSNTKKKMTFSPSCFRPSSATTSAEDYSRTPPSTTASNANLTTSLYQTHLGIFSLTWSRALLTRSLHLHLHPHPNLSLSSAIFHLSLKPFLFWNKQGFKELPLSSSKSIWVFWDLSKAKFGSGPDPQSGFYIAVLYEEQMTLLVGDLENEAYSKTKGKRGKNEKNVQSLVLRREHVIGKNKFYTTRIDFGGKSRLISIELSENREDGPKLVIGFDQKRVIQVKHLKWKFRGSERVEVDGQSIQLSWDVYNWLFEVEDCTQDDGCALFTFRFEKQGNDDDDGGVGVFDDEEERETGEERRREKGEAVTWSQDSCGLNYERKKMKKKLMVKTRSPSMSSSSISSVSSGCSSSVLEWESVEENELKGPTGFSLLVYAWKS